MRSTCSRIRLSTPLARLDNDQENERRATSEILCLPKNSLARKRALCNPSYHSGNSFLSFKPPMISFITSSHSSVRSDEKRKQLVATPPLASTYPNQCCRPCWRHPPRTNPRNTFENVVPNVCATLSIARSSLLRLSRRWTNQRKMRTPLCLFGPFNYLDGRLKVRPVDETVVVRV